MKILIFLCSILLSLLANDDNNSSFDSVFAPLISSNPNTGTNVGVVNSMVYNTDKKSSKSQALLMAQYSDTESWSVIGANSSYFDSNNYKFTVVGVYMHNNSELLLTLDAPLPSYPEDYVGSAKYEIDMYFAFTQLLYQVYPNFYAGGQVMYSDISFNPVNNAGSVFMLINGIQDTSNAAMGVALSYDTRSITEKIYPRDAVWIDLILNRYPTSLGNDESFTSTRLNSRVYMHGFKESDVWANQLYVQLSSDNTPDSGLAALGARDILRGFSVGQYKAKYMTAFQSEYRYELDGTNFKFVGFAGVASLTGGSKGKDIGNVNFSRKDDGVYYSGGVGIRYALQKKAGVDYRVDYSRTSKNDYGVYMTVNQSF